MPEPDHGFVAWLKKLYDDKPAKAQIAESYYANAGEPDPRVAAAKPVMQTVVVPAAAGAADRGVQWAEYQNEGRSTFPVNQTSMRLGPGQWFTPNEYQSVMPSPQEVEAATQENRNMQQYAPVSPEAEQAALARYNEAERLRQGKR
jgi:hypothetical protein